MVVPDIASGVSDIVSKMLIKDPRKRLSNLDELESVFESLVGLNVRKTGQWKSLLRYVILVVAVFTLCVILYNNHIHKQRKEKVIQSSVEAMSFRYITDDSSFPKSIDLTPIEMEPTTEDIKEKEQLINVTLKVLPWANVFVDGDSIGTAPFCGQIKLKRGRHSILLKNPYYPPISENVVIVNPCSLIYNLEERCAFLDIKVNPWGIVFIDGELVDTTPLQRPIAVTLGEHTIGIRHSSLGEKVKRVTADSTKLYQFTFDLKDE
jgi:serine/threonine protein kinase